MKLKILHVLHSLQVGGLENGVVNLINRLDPERFEHAICCIQSSGPMAERLVWPVEIQVIGKGPGRDNLLALKIARVIRQARPDVVHTRNWGTIDGVVAARLAGVRRVVHGEHGREAVDPTGANTRRNLARRVMSPCISRFVTVSDDLGKWLINDVGVPGDKVVQIINGVDTERFRPADDRAEAKRKVGLAPDLFVVGTVGRLDPVKNQQLLLRAFSSMSKTLGCGGQKVELLIVGAGPEEGKLRQLASDLVLGAMVHFAGERKDVADLMRAVDLFVLPSIAEGISNTVLEAMASGLPVVATDVGGNAELVVHGATGFLIDSGDEEALADTLVRCANSQADILTIGREARSRSERLFSLDAMVNRYAELYETMFDTCKRSRHWRHE
jgi:sugar transferase (PEP-CTERM/EpsH1 system associated)